ncbi:MAG: tRNA 2-thiouridine(34) synthase MnmA [Holosporales bacterium]|jgi:tRNA-specific 2-thiouridylase|nr:tRNA 2-thiouridine(34) synthase MnmA [Holosporales bacterium]
MPSSTENNSQRDKRIYAVAMSGGVDSSVVLGMLQKSGYEVFGITMDIHENCIKDIEDARSICRTLGIQHEVFDVREEYKAKVIDLFADYYSRGLTPNPCAFCNRDLKLNILVDYARLKGADLLATGHYANLETHNENIILSEAVNLAKDQTYFVSLAPKKKLMHVRFPLGRMNNKNETRALAAEYGLPNFEKDESQDICFIRQGNYKEFLKNLKTNLNLFSPGRIRRKDTGKIIGNHTGIANYTVGQRKGLGISRNDGSPLYVVDVDAANNDVLVGDKGALDMREFYVTEMNWFLEMGDEFTAFVKLRSFEKKTRASIKKRESCGETANLDSEVIQIELREESANPVTRGQVCVAYDEHNNVICAGIIA